MPYAKKVIKKACDLAAMFHSQNAASPFEQAVMPERTIDLDLVRSVRMKDLSVSIPY
jgi:hypothetical protein